MRKLIVFAALAGLGWYGYKHKQGAESVQSVSQAQPVAPLFEQPKRPSFACDGRVHCSQMTSCDEATFFINNCAGTKMDGDNDGVPCESQWCD